MICPPRAACKVIQNFETHTFPPHSLTKIMMGMDDS